jgi:DNA polymerase-3 subunit alpha
VQQLIKEFPPKREATEQGDLVQGVQVRLMLQRSGATGELDLGDEGRFFPSDAALQRWRQAAQGAAQLVYDNS